MRPLLSYGEVARFLKKCPTSDYNLNLRSYGQLLALFLGNIAANRNNNQENK